MRVQRAPQLAAVVASVHLLAGCASTEVSLLFGPRTVNGNTEPAAALEVRQYIGERTVCEYEHSSEPARGRPFNDKDETNVDMLGCGPVWGGGGR